MEGRPIYTLKGHTSSVTAVTFSKSGDYFASGSSDRQLYIWRSNFHKGEQALLKCEKLIPLDTEKIKLQDAKSNTCEIVDDVSSKDDFDEIQVSFLKKLLIHVCKHFQNKFCNF